MSFLRLYAYVIYFLGLLLNFYIPVLLENRYIVWEKIRTQMKPPGIISSR